MRLTLLMLFILLLTPISVLAHGDEHQPTETSETDTNPVSLSLETILLITILIGLLLLYSLFRIIGIEEQDLLLRMAVIALVLLLVDYTYIRYFR